MFGEVKAYYVTGAKYYVKLFMHKDGVSYCKIHREYLKKF